MSGGWFFLVAAEAIAVAGQDIKLPGIGSYIAVAIETRNATAMAWAIGAMLAGILLYDQLFFRPLLAWADKFRFEESQGDTAQQSWLLDWMRRSRWTSAFTDRVWALLRKTLTWFGGGRDGVQVQTRSGKASRSWERAWDITLIGAIVLATVQLVVFVHSEVGWREVAHVFGLGAITMLRVVVLIALASIVWVPAAVWIGLRPKYSQRVQAVAQFLAAFPINLMFPMVVFAMVAWHLSPNIWLSPLMVFGTQWYILFNVVAGASSIANELRLAADNLGLKGWLLWKRVYLPAVFPSFVTGAITASGGSWNASIVAEYVTWGKTTLVADGLGSYIKQMTQTGDFHRIALGIGVMCVFVMSMNRFFWRKLYTLAEDRH
jgi:NitT/TauT family transport system permease protein